MRPLNPGTLHGPGSAANDHDARPLRKGGGGGTSGGMENRVASLEAHMDHVRASLKKLEDMPERLRAVEVKVDHLPTRDDLHKLSGSFTARMIALLVAIAALIAFADRIQAFLR